MFQHKNNSPADIADLRRINQKISVNLRYLREAFNYLRICQMKKYEVIN